jgi:TatA/E family protein of Tat protein translocase
MVIQAGFVDLLAGQVSWQCMSLPDTIFIFGLALVIFGPKKLPEIGRQLGKLVLEFRRASNEFKMQIEEELRSADQADRQKALEAQTVTPTPLPEPVPDTLTVHPPSNGTSVSTESPAARVIPVQEEVAELKAIAGDHPELASNGLEHEPEQTTIHHD